MAKNTFEIGCSSCVWQALRRWPGMGASRWAADARVRHLVKDGEGRTHGARWLTISESDSIRSGPQGMVKIGDDFYVSSSEIRNPRRAIRSRSTATIATPEKAPAHLFKFDKRASLLADLPLGEGSGPSSRRHRLRRRYIWVPVAEYDPQPRDRFYRVARRR